VFLGQPSQYLPILLLLLLSLFDLVGFGKICKSGIRRISQPQMFNNFVVVCLLLFLSEVVFSCFFF
jgi:hypothetical protein